MAQVAVDYTRARTIIERGDLDARIALARDPGTLPEILFFLVKDPEVRVRRAVADNPATPVKAGPVLARDDDVGVRCALARKLVGHGLAAEERRAMWRMGFTILEALARDQIVRVRRILAEAFQAPPDAPRAIVLGLARDPARDVAGPVLRHSPVLTDDDMIAIVRDGAPDWAQEAIAGRDGVSPTVSEALSAAGSVPAVARMIDNRAARIDEPTMARIVDRAAGVPEWQAPLVARPQLSPGILAALARVVAAPLLGLLRNRPDLDAATAADIDRTIESRKNEPSLPAAPAVRGRGESPAQRVRRLHKAKALNDNAVAVALENGDHGFVIEALALRAGLTAARVRRMVAVRNGKTLMALAWKAGLSARFAMDLERTLARVPPRAIVNARDGLDFPFTPAEMTQHLALFDD
jgi:uncharacterized protein (DUF2336 family)